MFAPVPHCQIFYVQGKPIYCRQFICRVHIKERNITGNLDSRKHGITGVRMHYLSKTFLPPMFNSRSNITCLPCYSFSTPLNYVQAIYVKALSESF